MTDFQLRLNLAYLGVCMSSVVTIIMIGLFAWEWVISHRIPFTALVIGSVVWTMIGNFCTTRYAALARRAPRA